MKQVIDLNLRFTSHFVLGEFLRSNTADRLGINNTPLEYHIMRLRNLAQRSLEPVRQHLGLPIQVNSGYRCPELNAAVKGVKTSQHLLGEAADITIPKAHRPFAHATDEQAARLIYMYARQYADYDQLILEHQGSSWWVHISCRIDYRRNRRQELTIHN
jgi:hypothetical protein